MSNPFEHNPFEKPFAEFAADAFDSPTCDNCGDDIPADEANYNPEVRGGAPLCNECYAILTCEDLPELIEIERRIRADD